MNSNNMQTFPWGHIEWFINESMLNVAITTILPGQKQAPHIHYGNEQFIYVLSGSGKQFIDNEYSKKEPGMMFHIKAGSCHETINTSTEPLVELLVSVPINYEYDFFTEDKPSSFYPIDNVSKKINLDEDMEYIYDKLIKPLNIPICIFDNEGKCLIEGKDYPFFCKDRCNVHKCINNCSLYKIDDNYSTPPTKNSSAILCEHGISIFIFPLIYDNSFIGTIKGGHFKENYTNDPTDFNSFITPKSTILSIFQLMNKLRNQIINYYILKNTKMEL
ncbi:cupin domain-containing protein, partial [Anaeromicrobium sediminis]